MSSAPEPEFLTLHEVVEAARQRMDRNMWNYVIGGAETETTTRRNRLALDSLAFRPRVLRDVSRVDPSGTFFGRRIRLPVFMAPVAALENMHAEGAVAVALAAAQCEVPMFLSSVARPGLEDTACAAPGALKVFQLYIRGDDAWVDDHIHRARAAGYQAFCITADTAVYSRRERDIARRFIKPWRERAVGLDHQAAFNWRHIERIKRTHDVTLIVKGIATAEDASLACEHGVDAVYVSNHGGRQLDHGRGTLDMLPAIVAAVQRRAQVFVDGGVSRGSDIAKALALGADAVGLGRLYCYGLGAAGAAGVARVIELLEDELRICLALLGVDRCSLLDTSYLQAAPPVWLPHVLSAFPLLKPQQDE